MSKSYFGVLALAAAMAGLLPVGYSQAPAGAPKAVPPAKPAAGAGKGAAGAAKNAPPAKQTPVNTGRPFSKTELVTLMKSGRSGQAVAAEVQSRGLGFEPEFEDIAALFDAAGRPPSEFGSLKDFLTGLVAADIPVDEAKALIPKLLDQIAKAPGAPEVMELLHPDARADRSQVNAAFADYAKHTIGLIRPLDNSRRLAVPLYVYTKRSVERLQYALFTPMKSKRLLLRGVVPTTQELANAHLGAELQLAEQRLRDVYREVNTSRGGQTQAALATPALNDDLKPLGGWQRIVRNLNTKMGEVQIAPNAALDMTSVRLVLNVSQPMGGQRLQYAAEFERIGDDVKLVRLRDQAGRDIASDPNLTCYLQQRYGSQSCDKYQKAPTEQVYFAPLDDLARQCDRSLQEYKGNELVACAEELRVSFPSNSDTRGLSYRASALFLQRKYEEAEKVSMEVLKLNGTVRIPVLRYYSIRDAQNFRRVTLAMAKDGLTYEASPEAGGEKIKIPWPDVNMQKLVLEPKVGIGGIAGRVLGDQKAPLLRLSVYRVKSNGKRDDETWDIATFPTGCKAKTSRLPAGYEVYAPGNACFGNIPGNYMATTVAPGPAPVQFATSFAAMQLQVPGRNNNQVNEMIAPVGWREGLLTIQRLIQQLQAGLQ